MHKNTQKQKQKYTTISNNIKNKQHNTHQNNQKNKKKTSAVQNGAAIRAGPFCAGPVPVQNDISKSHFAE